VEFGTSFGILTLHLAAALRDNGGGRLITTEFEPSKVARARENLTAGGLIDLVELRQGDALQTLKADLPETIDLLLLDGAKALYPDVLALLEDRLRPGAFVVADDADASVLITWPGYARPARAKRAVLDLEVQCWAVGARAFLDQPKLDLFLCALKSIQALRFGLQLGLCGTAIARHFARRQAGGSCSCVVRDQELLDQKSKLWITGPVGLLNGH
jgi:hypothetical protein